MEGGGQALAEERQMDDFLKSVGLLRKKVAKDGSCLFRAVAEQVLHSQSLHTTVRAECVEFLKRNRGNYEAFIEGDFEDYVFRLQDPQRWVGEVEINALAAMYKKDFLIYQEPGKPPVNITGNNFEDKVRLCFLNGNHYDSVYPASRIKSAALCQSVLYELLYDGVFQVERNLLGACQRVGRPSDVLSDDSLAPCHSSDESDLDAGEPPGVENGSSPSARRGNHHHRGRGRGRGRLLPESVRRSLNPTLLRNVQYDVWNKTKTAQQKMDYSIAAGMQYNVGDRCRVRLEGGGRSLNAVVKEVPQNSNTVVVQIEEQGKRSVPLCSLRPPSDEKSWSTVLAKDKKLHNGCGEREEKAKGRGRAAAPASAGRVQSQHSWPPQATPDEGGGAKSGRKSLESPGFGLTQEERSAREEEQRNVALVEIQLRDEHSFPALGNQSPGDGTKKSGEKKRPQRSKEKSPVEDGPPESPPAADPPPALPSDPAPAVDAPPPSDPSSLKVKASNRSQASSDPSPGSSSAPPPPPRPPSRSVPCSATVFLSPVLPTGSSPPASSVPAPTFIAPIAPSPLGAQGFLPPSSVHRASPPLCALSHSPSPPPPPPPASSFSSSLHVAQVQEAPPAPPKTLDLLLVSGAPAAEPPAFQVPPTLSQSLSPTGTEPTRVEVQSQTTQVQVRDHQVQTSAQLQPAAPSQRPHPSVGTPTSPTPTFAGSHAPIDPNPTEGAQPAPPAQPNVQPGPPPNPLPVPGGVPLQSLAQLYQDPLYPGFPQEEGGNMAPTPPFCCRGSGEDLPRDFNTLRFFFNLGVKAYSMPLFPPYLYLLPLQQANSICPRPLSRSPSPHRPPSRPQEAYLPYAPQAPPPDSSFGPAGYPVAQHPPHQMPGALQPWQPPQMAPQANSGYSVGYPSANPAYPGPPPPSQGYGSGQVPGHALCPPYPSSSLAYQSPEPKELQGGRQATGGNMVPGQGLVPVLLEGPSAANASNHHRALSGLSGLVRPKEQAETRTVLLVDPPLNNTPIPVSMPACPPPYGVSSKTTFPADASFVYRQPSPQHNPAEGYRMGGRASSVGFSTEDNWEQAEGFSSPALMPRRPFRGHRGGRGGAYDGARGGNRRRQAGNAFNHGHLSHSHRGRGW